MYIIRKLKQKEILSSMSFSKHFFIAVTNGLSVAQLISCTKPFCCKSYFTSLLVCHPPVTACVFKLWLLWGTAWHTLDVCAASTTMSPQPGWGLPVPIFIWIIANPKPMRVLWKKKKTKPKRQMHQSKRCKYFPLFHWWDLFNQMVHKLA